MGIEEKLGHALIVLDLTFGIAALYSSFLILNLYLRVGQTGRATLRRPY